MIDEAALHEEEIAQYRDEIVTLGQDAVKLYCNANQNNIEVDPIIKQIITVFQAFKTLYTPVLVIVSEDTNELLQDLDDFQANAHMCKSLYRQLRDLISTLVSLNNQTICTYCALQNTYALNINVDVSLTFQCRNF